MFLYHKFFGGNPVEAELYPADIENTTRNSTGFSYHLTQVIKGTMLLGTGVAGYLGVFFTMERERECEGKYHSRK